MRTGVGTLLERRRRVFLPGVGALYGDDAVEVVRGCGTRVWDREGREYLDFLSGVGVTNLGHCHPEVVEAAERQLRTLQHTTTLFLTECPVALAERLVGFAPAGLARVFFCADGSGANEGAMLAARAATGRPDFIAFDRSLHGRTSLTLAATGLGFWRSDPFPPPVVHHIPSPVDAGGAAASAGALQELLDGERGDRIAALIAEPVLGNGGIVVPPPGYFRTVRRLLSERGALLVADEAQTGFCRTGRWFGMEHWDVCPDLMTVAKGLANGLPAAAWLASEAVGGAMTRPCASTFGGNAVAMAAGLKTLEIMERDALDIRAARLGGRLLGGLRRLAGNHASAGAVRGLGLMAGVEIERGGLASAEMCERVLVELKREGVLAGRSGPGRNVVTLLPPLIATEAEIDTALESLETALGRAERLK